MRRKLWWYIIAAAILLAASIACVLIFFNTKPQPEPPVEDAPVQLVYYTIGDPDTDLAAVNDALNEILLAKYGFTVQYNKIGWNNYEVYLNALIDTNQNFDIAFSWGANYHNNAKNGDWLDLTDLLQSSYPELYNTVNEKFWKGVSINGRIWGIPTNKELATPLQFLYSQELVDKYQINISNYTNFASLEPLLRRIKLSEPDCIPLFFDTTHHNLLAPNGYEYITYETIPLMVNSSDPQCKVVNIFDTNQMRSVLNTLHHYYQLGYINQDACIRTSLSRFGDEQVFLRLSSGGPDTATSYSNTFGYPIVVQQVSASTVSTTSTCGGIMVVNAKTEHPQECMTFLKAINTDPEIRNLLNYGIEGVHYALDDQGQVQTLSDAYQGVSYTQGNWFILYTRQGESLNRWQLYEQFNEEAQESYLLGFTPDYSSCLQEFNAVVEAYDKYYSALMTGAVDPEIYLPKLQNALRDAGIDVLKTTLQRQINDWLANNP